MAFTGGPVGSMVLYHLEGKAGGRERGLVDPKISQANTDTIMVKPLTHSKPQGFCLYFIDVIMPALSASHATIRIQRECVNYK